MNIDLPKVEWESKGWTIPGQLRKLNEETGEVAEAVALQDWVNAIRETLDFIQVGHTMLDMIQVQWREEFGQECPMPRFISEHREKLARKGYLDNEGDPYAGREEVD